MKIVKLTMAASIMGIGICANLNATATNHLKIKSTIIADDEKGAFKKKLNKRINEVDKKIDNLNADIKRAGKKADADYDREVERLKSTSAELKVKLDNFKEESKDNWVDFKKNIENETDKFQNEVDAFIKKRKN